MNFIYEIHRHQSYNGTYSGLLCGSPPSLQTQEPSPCLSLKTSFATIYEDGTATTINNPSIYDTNKGIAFEYQDKLRYIDIYSNPTKFSYYGEGFACVMRFGSSFMKWNGYARSYYNHTWSKTGIDSIGFAIGADSFGFDVSWSETLNHMDFYSNSDTSF